MKKKIAHISEGYIARATSGMKFVLCDPPTGDWYMAEKNDDGWFISDPLTDKQRQVVQKQMDQRAAGVETTLNQTYRGRQVERLVDGAFVPVAVYKD